MKNLLALIRSQAAPVLVVLGISALSGAAVAQDGAPSKAKPAPYAGPGILRHELLFNEAPFPSSHASTIVESRGGLVASWFGGTAERNPDVTIWVSRWVDGKWTAPAQAADGIVDGGKRYPCWNPVLMQGATELVLFYKVGPSPETWWGMVKRSSDNGVTWGEAVRLPDGFVGPVRNKGIPWKNGWLCGSSTEDKGWTIHMEWTPDEGRTWQKTPPLHNATEWGLIQPTLLEWPGGKVQALHRSRQKFVVETLMIDQDWKRWTAPAAIPSLPNPNSAVDAVMLQDGRALMVYNHLRAGRTQINVAVSKDGKKWEAACLLQNTPGEWGEYSYPAVIQSKDGKVHITYTWKRKKIQYAVIDPARIESKAFVGAEWP